MKKTFYVGEIRSFFADVDGKDVEMVLVTRLDQIITTHDMVDYAMARQELIEQDKEFAVYPSEPYTVAIDPTALAGFFAREI